MTTQENSRKPYLFKDFGYRFENEVRFVFAIDPEVTEEGGALIDIDSRSFVTKVLFSPKIQIEEKRVIEDLAMRALRSEDFLLNLPRSHEEGWLRALKIQARRPFDPEEGLPDLFSELV